MKDETKKEILRSQLLKAKEQIDKALKFNFDIQVERDVFYSSVAYAASLTENIINDSISR